MRENEKNRLEDHFNKLNKGQNFMTDYQIEHVSFQL